MVILDKVGLVIWFGRLLLDLRVKMFKVNWLDVKKVKNKSMKYILMIYVCYMNG